MHVLLALLVPSPPNPSAASFPSPFPPQRSPPQKKKRPSPETLRKLLSSGQVKNAEKGLCVDLCTKGCSPYGVLLQECNPASQGQVRAF